MVERIGSSGALAREALRAALAAAERAKAPAAASEPASGSLAERLQQSGPARSAEDVDFSRKLGESIQAVERDVQAIDGLPEDLLTGRVDDFHEIAVQLKSAELSFRFAMEIRNKLVDAYREIMRMTV